MEKETAEAIKEALSEEKEHMLKQEIPGTDHIATFIECLDLALDEMNGERVYAECNNLVGFSKQNLSDLYLACEMII
jgi:hypothetical protein